jgi:hypothetical protein
MLGFMHCPFGYIVQFAIFREGIFMEQMTQRVVPKPARGLYETAPMRAVCPQSAVDQGAELRRLRTELARTRRELKELRDTTASMVRSLL